MQRDLFWRAFPEGLLGFAFGGPPWMMRERELKFMHTAARSSGCSQPLATEADTEER